MATATTATPKTVPSFELPSFDVPSFDVPSFDEASQRIRDLNERLLASSKSAGLVALDTYEKSLQSMVEFEEKIASASQLEWVSAMASTQAKFITELSSSFTAAARDLLK